MIVPKQYQDLIDTYGELSPEALNLTPPEYMTVAQLDEAIKQAGDPEAAFKTAIDPILRSFNPSGDPVSVDDPRAAGSVAAYREITDRAVAHLNELKAERARR